MAAMPWALLMNGNFVSTRGVLSSWAKMAGQVSIYPGEESGGVGNRSYQTRLLNGGFPRWPRT